MVNTFLLQSHKVPKNINHIQGIFSFRGMILHNGKYVDEIYFQREEDNGHTIIHHYFLVFTNCQGYLPMM